MYSLFLLSHSTLSDADWACNLNDHTSTTTYVVFIGANVISWSSKTQKSISQSSAEAEYRVVANTTSKLCWLVQLLHELHVPMSMVPTIYCDNVGTIYLNLNSI